MGIARKNVSARLASGALKPRVGSGPSVPLPPAKPSVMCQPDAVARVQAMVKSGVDFAEAYRQVELEVGAA